MNARRALAVCAALVALGALAADDGPLPRFASFTNCTDVSGNHLNYTAATKAFSCGTTSSSGNPIESLSGYNVLNAEESIFAAHVAMHTGTGGTVAFVVDVAGVAAAGSAVLEILDGATQRCTLTFACDAAVGTVQTAACAQTFTSGNQIKAQWDSTSGCTTLPLGNVSLPWQ